MNCSKVDLCDHRECEYIPYIQSYINEPLIAFTCPDKDEEYLAKKDRGKELDLLLKAESSEWAIEVKKIILGKRAEEANAYRLIDIISEKLGDNHHKVNLRIKKSLNAKWKDIERFLDRYISEDGINKYSNKYLDIHLVKETREENLKEFVCMDSWDPPQKQVDNSTVKVVSLILSSNNGNLTFVVDFPKARDIHSYVFLGLDIVDEMNKKSKRHI